MCTPIGKRGVATYSNKFPKEEMLKGGHQLEGGDEWLPVLCCVSQAKHATEGNMTWGVDGDKGVLTDMSELGIWEPLSVKVQTFKTAIEVS